MANSTNGHAHTLPTLQSWLVASGPLGPGMVPPGERPLTDNELAVVQNIGTLRIDMARRLLDSRRDVREATGVPRTMPDALAFLRLYLEDAVAGAVVDRYPEETYKIAGEVWDGDSSPYGSESVDDLPEDAEGEVDEDAGNEGGTEGSTGGGGAEKSFASRGSTVGRNAEANCGIGPGGFQPGNTCAKGGSSRTDTYDGGTATTFEDEDDASRSLFTITSLALSRTGKGSKAKSGEIGEVTLTDGTTHPIIATPITTSATGRIKLTTKVGKEDISLGLHPDDMAMGDVAYAFGMNMLDGSKIKIHRSGSKVEIQPGQRWQGWTENVALALNEISKPAVAETPFNEAWARLQPMLRTTNISATDSFYKGEEYSPFWKLMCDWDKASRVGRFGLLFIALDDGKDLREPAGGLEEEGSISDGYPYEYVSRNARTDEDWEDYEEDRGRKLPRDGGWEDLGGRRVVFNTARPTLTNNAAPRRAPYSLTHNAESDGAKKMKEGDRPVLFCRVFTEAHATPIRWERNLASPRYGQPTAWHIDFGDPLAVGGAVNGPADSREVHWTRVRVLKSDARFNGHPFAGVPACWPVYPQIYNLQKIAGASGEGYWASGLPLKYLKTPPAIAGSRTVVRRQTIKDEIEKMMSAAGDRWGVFENLEPGQLEPSLADPTPHVRMNYEQIAIALNIPLNKLIGDPSGKLAAATENTGDWDDAIRGRQNKRAIPEQIAPCIDWFIQLGLLPEPECKEFHCGWPAVDSLGKMERADVMTKVVTAIGTYVEKGCDAIMAPEDLLVEYLDKTPEEAQAMLERAAEASAQRMQSEMDQQVEQQGRMIDEGLAPDPTDPEQAAIEHDKQVLDLAGKVRPSGPPKGKPGFPPTKNELREMSWLDDDGRLVRNAAKASAKTKLTGGRWVTLDNGVKVYLKSGKVVAGPAPVVKAMSEPRPEAKETEGSYGGAGPKEPTAKSEDQSAGQKYDVTDKVRFMAHKFPGTVRKPTDPDLSPRESADLHGRNFGEHSAKLTDKQRDAMGTYMGSDFVDINAGLRGQSKLSPEHEQVVKDFDSAFEGSRTKERMTLHRGIENLDRFGDPSKLVGKTFQDDSYTSTSTVGKVADGFSRYARFEIELPVGSKALSMDAALGSERSLNQHEVVLPRGTKYHITGIEKRPVQVGGVHLYDYHVIKAKVVQDG